MKKYLLLLLIPLASCQALQFDRYPGTAFEKFPEDLIGSYQNVDGLGKKMDTLFVTINEKSIYSKHDKDVHGSELDASHVFSMYSNQYYYFVREHESWSGFSMAKRKNNLVITPFVIPHGREDSVRNIKVLKRYFKDVKCIRMDSFNLNYQMSMNEQELHRYSKKMKKNRIICTQIKSNE